MRRPSGRREEGSVSVEAVVLVPILMIFVLLALACGRYEMIRAQVIGAARAAAEAAAIAPSPSAAGAAAETAASPDFSGVGRSCTTVSVRTDTVDFKPGGEVAVNVTCSVDLTQIGAPGLPGSVVVSVSQTAPIDPYRVVS
jgi:Flp pilus assembly protein TadG